LSCLPVTRPPARGGEAASVPSPLLVAGYALGGLSSWQLPSGQPVVPRGWEAAHHGRISALAVLGSGELLSAASEGALKAWSLEEDRFGDMVRSFSGHGAAVVSVAASPFHESLLVSGSHDRTVRLWDSRKPGDAVARWRQQDWVTCVHFHPSLDSYVLSSDKAVHLWDLRCLGAAPATAAADDGTPALGSSAGPHLASFHRHRKLISRFRVDPLRLASCSLDGSVKVSSLEAPGLRVASPQASPVNSPVMGPATAPLHDQREATLRASTDYVLCIDFDATRLLAGGVDGRVDVYDFSCSDHFYRGSPVLGPEGQLAAALAVARGGGRCGEAIDMEMLGMEEIEV